jgi:hypothetical protein
MTIVDSLRSKHPNLILIDGGDWSEVSANLAKSMKLYRGMQALKYDALCMGRRELESALWDSISAKAGFEKTLVANIQTAGATNGKKLSSQSFKTIERGGIKVAVVSTWLENTPTSGGFYQILPAENYLREKLRDAKKSDVRVVSVYSNKNSADSTLKAFTAKFPEVDAWLLAGGPGRVMSSVTATNGALIVGPGDRGRELGFLTIEKGKDVKQRRAEFKSIALGKWVKDSPAAKALMESSNHLGEPAKSTPTPTPTPTLTPTPTVASTNRYIGNGSCKLCHEQIFDKWQDTKHAHAFETLVAKKEDKNQKCLSCHTTGFGQATGFGNALDGVNLKGVGCEGCHGTGEYHVTSGNRNTVAPTEALCKSCHDAANSPKFVFEEYVKRVH